MSAAQFAAAWRWEQTHLQLPDGLFAYHWSGGKVVNAEPATDADLDTAWALVLAGQRFHNSQYLAQGLRVASAVLSNETTVVAGALQLVAGPWGRSSPAVADPSYFSLDAMDALENGVGRSTVVRAGRRFHGARRLADRLRPHASRQLGRPRAHRIRTGDR